MTEQAQAAPGGQETAAQVEGQQPQEGAGDEQQPKVYDEAYVSELRKENAKARTLNKSLEKQVEEARTAGLSEAEKAIAEAEQRGRTATRLEYGARLARQQFDALAGRRNGSLTAKDIDEILEFTDLSRFVGEDGEPDPKVIQAAVERLVPEAAGAPGAPPSFDGGARSKTPAPVNFNDAIRTGFGYQK